MIGVSPTMIFID